MTSPPPTVLVVDDDVDVATAISEILSFEGFRPVAAHSVAEAIEAVRREHPVFVLLDWYLPDGTGSDVVRGIRPLDASVPIVVMSGAREALEASLSVDARDRLAKPLALDHLVSLVRSYVH